MDKFPWNIYGQDRSIDLLEKIKSSQKIPHAFLFKGMDGIGKHLSAIYFASLINSHTHIKKISQLTEPYIKYIFPLPRGKGETSDDTAFEKLDADTVKNIQAEIIEKSKNPYYKLNIEGANFIKINSIRDIRKFISLNFDELKYRVILIEDAHMMNEEAQNALLKSLEEPPEGIIFILITPYVDKLLPTIQSRCWQINFDPLESDDIAKILREFFGVEHQLSEQVSYFCNGSVIDAVELINNDFEKLLEDTVFLLRYSLGKKYHSTISFVNEFVQENSAESLKLLIQMITKWLNDTIRNRVNYEDYYFSEYKDTLIKFNEKFGNKAVNQTINKLNELSSAIDRNVNLNLIILGIIFELSFITMR
jgi:DNA polymerase-3 subunit delta'